MKKALKKVIALLLALVIGFSLTGCQRQEPMPADDMQQLALGVVDLLCEGKIQEAYSSTTSSLQYIMSYDNFELSWLGGIEYSGKLISSLGVVMDRWDSAQVYIVDVGVDFSGIGVIARFFFNEYGEMTMFTAFSNDFNDDTPLPDGVTEKDIEITTAEGLTVHGKIALPTSGESTVPAVVLMPGSGSVDMDCPYGNIKVMRDIAYGLAEQGIASVRLNKRTHESTQISSLTYSFDIEYLQDFSAAYALLENEPAIDSEQIYLLGHSQASIVVPMLDQIDGINSAGYILLSGTNRYLWELTYDQNINFLNFNPNLDSLNALNTERGKAEKLKNQSAMESQQVALYGTNSYYYWYDVNNRVDLDQVTKPVLLIRGADDHMTYDADWDSLIKGYWNAQVTAVVMPGLSHVLAPSSGMQSSADYFVDANVSSEAIDKIADFILEQ